MIMCLYGEDTFRLKQKQREIIARFEESFDPSRMNVALFTAKDTEGDILTALGAPPFLAKRRMVVIDGLMESTTIIKEARAWAEKMAGLGEETVVVLTDPGLPVEKAKKSKLTKALGEQEEDVYTYAFDLLPLAQLRGWVLNELKELGAEWAPEAVEVLMERVGADTWRLHTEIQKIVSAHPKATAEDVRNLVAPRFGDTLFQFLDAVRAQNKKTATELLTNELSRGTSPGQLIAMLGREVQLLCELRAFASVHGSGSGKDAARVLGCHPFVVKKTMPKAASLDSDQVTSMLDAVLAADRRLKSTSMQDKAVIEQLVIDLVADES